MAGNYGCYALTGKTRQRMKPRALSWILLDFMADGPRSYCEMIWEFSGIYGIEKIKHGITGLRDQGMIHNVPRKEWCVAVKQRVAQWRKTWKA